MNLNLNDLLVLIKIYFLIVYSFILNALDYADIPYKTFAVLCILMTTDIITGIYKGFVLKELSSSPIITGILKKARLLIAIYIIFLGVTIVPEFGFIGNLFIGMFVLAELISILGNISAANQKQRVTEHDALVQVIEVLKDLFKKRGKVDDGDN